MTIADLGNMKIRIPIKGDNPGKGLKIMRNDNKKPESKKRESDDFKVGDDDDAGKQIKRRRRIDNRSITQDDGGRVFPAPIRRLRGVDCQQVCLQNPTGGISDYQDMNNSTPPLHLHKEKESNCRSDHSSSSPTATIDEGCTTATTSLTVGAQLSPTKALRAAQMKKRYAHLIFKANHQALMPHGDNADPQQERERLQRQEIAEKARIDEEIKASGGQTLLSQRQREREAARIALDKMGKTVEFNDALQIMRDFESLLNAK